MPLWFVLFSLFFIVVVVTIFSGALDAYLPEISAGLLVGCLYLLLIIYNELRKKK